jgi:hypothetical protein
MRWVLPVLLLVPLAGCIDGADLLGSSQDCTPEVHILTNGAADMLLPATLPREQRRSTNPDGRLTVHARPGQTVNAAAVWDAMSGKVGVLYDGPMGNGTETDRSWGATATAAGGNYSLELVGDPAAFDVGFVLILQATGCTPAASAT